MRFLTTFLMFSTILNAEVSLNCFLSPSPKPKIAQIFSCDVINRNASQEVVDLALIRDAMKQFASPLTIEDAQNAVNEFNKRSRWGITLNVINLATLGFSIAQGFIKSEQIPDKYKAIPAGISGGLTLTSLFVGNNRVVHTVPTSYIANELQIPAKSSVTISIFTHPQKNPQNISSDIVVYTALDYIEEYSPERNTYAKNADSVDLFAFYNIRRPSSAAD